MFKHRRYRYRPKAWTTRPTSLPNPNLCVYIIKFHPSLPFTAFKIGVTGQDGSRDGKLTGVEKRLNQLQTGCPWRLVVAAVIHRPDDAYKFEEYLHRKYSKWRIRSDGEFFDFGPGYDPVEIVTKGLLPQ